MQNKHLHAALSLLIFFVVWQIAVSIFAIPTWVLPAPVLIFSDVADDLKLYAVNGLSTLLTTLFGFLLAMVIGVTLAIAIVYSKLVENGLFSLLISFNSIPKIALAPLFVIWLGTGPSARIWVAFMVAFFPVVIDTILGLRSVDPEALDLFRTMRGSRLQALFKIRLPHALPYIFSGLKVAISFALVGAIAGEFISSQTGLGSLVLIAQGMFQTDRIFAALLVLGVMGTILFYLVDLAERWACPWHVSQRGSAKGPTTGH